MKKIGYILLSLGVLSLGSCVDDYFGNTENVEITGEGKTIVFTLADLSEQTTRATVEDTANERAIDKLDLFFYNSTGTTCVYKPTELNITENRVTISIPVSQYLEMVGERYRFFVLANYYGTPESIAGKSLAQLRQLVVENTGARMFNGAASPSHFVMSGESAAPVEIDDTPSQYLDDITLTRTAAKIVVEMLNATIYDEYEPGTVIGTGDPTYTAVGARLHLNNYLDVAWLDSTTPYSETLGGSAGYDAYKTVMDRALTPIETGGVVTGFSMDGNALYSYPNDWNDDIKKQTYITLEVDWETVETGEEKTYYYRIPFSYIVPDQDAGDHTNKIRSNYIYEFKVNVSELGGLDPTMAVDLAANFDIIDWNTGQVDVSLLQFHYLFVVNPDVTSYQSSYEWEYVSSLLLANNDITITAAYCDVYTTTSGGTTNNPRRINYMQAGSTQRPTLTRRTAGNRTYFKVTGWVPENYVPLYIELTVKNDANIAVNVRLEILPGEYVTAGFSNGGINNSDGFPIAGAWNHPIDTSSTGSGSFPSITGPYGNNVPNGQSTTDNYNFYQINTATLPDRELLVGGVRKRIMLGDPTMASTVPTSNWTHIDGYEYIETDPDKNYIVSPSFIVASRRGATSQLTWSQGYERCKRYREGQYPSGTWRMPTFAELAMLGDMQNDPDSAIKGLFIPSSTTTGTGWWTGSTGYRIRADLYYYSTGNNTPTPGVNVGNSTSAAVRCVRDTWKEYPQDHYGVYGEFRDGN